MQEYQAKEDFYTLYTGYYNVFFIDETTIHKGKENAPPEFEVANFIFEGKQGEFYFKKWDSDELEVNKVHPLKNSPRSNFYVQEVDEKWAYMFSFKRPRNIKAGIGRKFPFYYLGSTEPREEEFAGIGYAVKVESPDKLFLPQRELKRLNTEKLVYGIPITTVEMNNDQKRDLKSSEVYKHLLENGKPVENEKQSELTEIQNILLSQKYLLYYEDKKEQ